MCTLEITMAQDENGGDFVLIRDCDMQEVARLHALSPGHAKGIAAGCAMIVARTTNAAVVLNDLGTA